jgi:hypothetical protein
MRGATISSRGSALMSAMAPWDLKRYQAIPLDYARTWVTWAPELDDYVRDASGWETMPPDDAAALREALPTA